MNTRDYLIERRTRAYGRLKIISRKIKDQARNRVIHEIPGLTSLWVLRWGGAEWMEYRFRAGLFYGYFAIGWSADQIKLYVFLWLIISTALFLVGLFVPGVREAFLF